MTEEERKKKEEEDAAAKLAAEKEEEGKKEEEEEELTPEEKREALKEREKELAKRNSGEEDDDEDEDEEEEDDDFFEDDEKAKKKEEARIDKLVEEKLRPYKEKAEQEAKFAKGKVREKFFNSNPQYLKDSKKWQSLLDTMEDLSPNLSYEDSLEKAHIILDGSSNLDKNIEDYKKQAAIDAAGSGQSNSKGDLDGDGLSETEKKFMKDNGYTPEMMKNYKKKIDSGKMIHHQAL